MPEPEFTETGLPANCAALSGPPPWEPDRWDETTNVYNNCYNYATNQVTYRASQPGEWKGPDGKAYLDRPASETVRCEFLIVGCLKDNLGWIAPGTEAQVRCGENCHRIALFAKPPLRDEEGNWIQRPDFHFIRQDRDGTWSEKPGPLAPRRILRGGQPIRKARKWLDPEHEEDGWSYCASFCVCRCSVQVSKTGDQTAWREEFESSDEPGGGGGEDGEEDDGGEEGSGEGEDEQ